MGRFLHSIVFMKNGLFFKGLNLLRTLLNLLNIVNVISNAADSIAQTTFSERLKADNMRVKQQLADVQQRALHDKVWASPHN